MSKNKAPPDLSSPNSDNINRLESVPASAPTSQPSGSFNAVEQPEPDPSDAFHLKNLRLSQKGLVGSAEKLITTYSVRKPKPNAFFRVRPGEDYQAEAFLYVDTNEEGLEKETYLLSTAFAARLDDEILGAFKPAKLFLAIERHAEKPFVWPVRFPLGDSKDNEYWRTAREHAITAMSRWIRIEAKEGSYLCYHPNGRIPEPIWTKVSFSEILRLAFKNRLISQLDHPIIKDLYGEE